MAYPEPDYVKKCVYFVGGPPGAGGRPCAEARRSGQRWWLCLGSLRTNATAGNCDRHIFR